MRVWPVHRGVRGVVECILKPTIQRLGGFALPDDSESAAGDAPNLRRGDDPFKRREGPAFPGMGTSGPSKYPFAVEKPTPERLVVVQAFLDKKEPLPKHPLRFEDARGDR